MEKAYPIKIGLEIHGYLATTEKLFCMCLAGGDDSPNSRICPICTGQPGSKPMMPNGQALRNLIKIGLVMGCEINSGKSLIWQRKHYNWADLPKGFQSTISGGAAVFPAGKGNFRGIGITECHLEEDPAQWNPETGKINYNRSGLPLIEIVTDPDFRSSDEVIDWLKNLILSLSYIKTIDKAGGIKVDVNVSTYGERVEIKNIHSLEDIRNAIEYEIARQIENHGKGIVQNRETLTYDSSKGKTIKMRDKESADDYRFISEPDLPVIVIGEKLVKEVEAEIPEMPDVKLKKLVEEYSVDKKNADILAKNLELVEFFEALVGEGIDMKKNLSWITIELLRVLNYNKMSLDDAEVEILPGHLAELIRLVDSGEITVLKGKQIMNDFVPKSFSIAEKGDIGKIADDAVANLCRQVIDENAHVVEQYREGKEASLNFLIGQVMRLSERRADFAKAKEVLVELIGGEE